MPRPRVGWSEGRAQNSGHSRWEGQKENKETIAHINLDLQLLRALNPPKCSLLNKSLLLAKKNNNNKEKKIHTWDKKIYSFQRHSKNVHISIILKHFNSGKKLNS